MVEPFGGIATRKRAFFACKPRAQGSRTVGEFRDRGFAQQASGRLLDRAVTVEKQPVVATDDDTQVARQRHRIAQAPCARTNSVRSPK